MFKAINNKIAILIIVVLSFLIYGKATNYQFVWDDERSHLTKHNDLMNNNLSALWKKPYDGMYIPVTYTIWMGIKKVAYNDHKKELNPKLFHFANILFHTSNAGFIFLILSLLFKDKFASLAGSLLFLLHPLQVESVAWVSEFRGVLGSFFSFTSIYLFIKHITVSSETDFFSRNKNSILATLFFILGLLSKPSVVVLPFVLAIIVFTFYKEKFKISLKVFLLWLILFIPIAYITSKSQGNELLSFVTPIWQRPFLASYSILFYIFKFILPYNLAACYGVIPENIVGTPSAHISFAVLLILSILLFKNEKYKIYRASFLIFIVSLLPTVGLVSFHYQRFSNMADRYVYFGMFAFAILLAHLWKKYAKQNYFKYAIALVLCTCTILTSVQLKTWGNEFEMWNNAVIKHPEQWTALYNRGVQYGKQGKFKEAIQDYSDALLYQPNNKNTLVNRANAYGTIDKFDLAIADYSSAIKIDENDASIYYNRALTYYYMKNIKACSYDLQMAIRKGFRADPEFVAEVKTELKQQFSK